jgi:alkanesulfonate monooxygenase
VSRLRFGVWAPVHGSRGALQDPEEPFDASWARNKALVLEAEALGYDSTLVAQHTANPYDDEWDELDAWTGAAALAALTSRIEIIAAIKPPLVHPVILAKMAMQIEHVSAGRFALNLVNAWNRAEYEKTGIHFAPHDERYAYGAEWAGLVERLLRGERVTHKGDYFDIADFQIRPADPYRARPLIYVGGESAPAQDLVAAHGDVWFINGQPLENVQALIASVRKLPRSGAPLRFGLSAFVIARETAGKAQAAYEHLVDLAHKDDEIRARQKQNTDAAVVMKHTHIKSKNPIVGTNGGTYAGLVGSYDEIAVRIAAFGAAGIELFMLQFQPFEAEMRRFAKEIFPRVQAEQHRPAREAAD